MSIDPLAGILAEAERNRRRDRAASVAAITTATASSGDETVGIRDDQAPGNIVILDQNGKIPTRYLYTDEIGDGSGGSGGGTGAKRYEHTQDLASTTWVINHGLGAYPTPDIADTGGHELIAEILWPDANNLVVKFGKPKAGTARLLA